MWRTEEICLLDKLCSRTHCWVIGHKLSLNKSHAFEFFLKTEAHVKQGYTLFENVVTSGSQEINLEFPLGAKVQYLLIWFCAHCDFAEHIMFE